MSMLLRCCQFVSGGPLPLRSAGLAALWQRSAICSTGEQLYSTASSSAATSPATEAGAQQADPSASASSSSSSSSSSRAVGNVKPDLVDKLLGLELASKKEQHRRARVDIVKAFQRHTGDVGSPEVMVAVWTQRIRDLAQDFQHHRKNYHMMRELELMFNRRRRMLIYMRQADFAAYCYTIQKLGLKDLYTEIHAEDRYPEGSLHKQPADDRVRRLRFAYHPEYRQKKTNLWKQLKPKMLNEDTRLVLDG